MEGKEHLSSWLGKKSLLVGLFSQYMLSPGDVPGAFTSLVSYNRVTLEVMVHQDSHCFHIPSRIPQEPLCMPPRQWETAHT